LPLNLFALLHPAALFHLPQLPVIIASLLPFPAPMEASIILCAWHMAIAGLDTRIKQSIFFINE
jgi:hypothetical protein